MALQGLHVTSEHRKLSYHFFDLMSRCLLLSLCRYAAVGMWYELLQIGMVSIAAFCRKCMKSLLTWLPLEEWPFSLLIQSNCANVYMPFCFLDIGTSTADS